MQIKAKKLNLSQYYKEFCVWEKEYFEVLARRDEQRTKSYSKDHIFTHDDEDDVEEATEDPNPATISSVNEKLGILDKLMLVNELDDDEEEPSSESTA